MDDMRRLVDQVLKNCDISDSIHAGLYTVCGLALRLRDLYKWEKQLAPWEDGASSEILGWNEQKEHTWN
ncbi:MAG: hypothetical protein JRI36_02980, partial [Deltaproteobacteria bacterium]|nr:hypothetical protein [Deltaproteobacteria bacterium]